MQKGGNRSPRFARDAGERPEVRLAWIQVAAQTFALGRYGTVLELGASSRWLASAAGRTIGVFASLEEAEDAVEKVARFAGYEITG